MLTKLPRFLQIWRKSCLVPTDLWKKKRKEKHQITRILSKCEGPKVKSKQCRPQLAIWVVSFHALWCQELWNGSTPFQLKHRVIYYRALTTKPLGDCYSDLFYICSLLSNTLFIRFYGSKLHFFIYNFFQNKFSKWKSYFVFFFSSWNKEKMLLELVVQRTIMPCPSIGP